MVFNRFIFHYCLFWLVLGLSYSFWLVFQNQLSTLVAALLSYKETGLRFKSGLVFKVNFLPEETFDYFKGCSLGFDSLQCQMTFFLDSPSSNILWTSAFWPSPLPWFPELRFFRSALCHDFLNFCIFTWPSGIQIWTEVFSFSPLASMLELQIFPLALWPHFMN